MTPRLALALSIGLSILAAVPGPAMSEEMVVETDKTYTRGTYNNQPGYWVEFQRKRYTKNLYHFYDPVGAYDSKIQEAFVQGLGLNRALDRATREQIYRDYGIPSDISQGYNSAYHDFNFDSALARLKADIAAGKFASVPRASAEDLALMNKLIGAKDSAALVEAIGGVELNAEILETFADNMREGQAKGAWWGAAGYQGGAYIYTASDNTHFIGYNHGLDWKSPTLDMTVYNANRDKSVQSVLLNDPAAFKSLTQVGFIDAIAQAARFNKMAELMEKGISPAGIKIDTVVNTTNGPARITEGQPTPARLRDLARWLISTSWTTHSPIALDLNHDGRIGVTGPSTAQRRMHFNKFEPQGAVWFDIKASGQKQHIEWLNGDGDGFLVDDTGGRVSAAAAGNGEINATALFGNAVGYANGYHKLAYAASRHQVASVARLDARTEWASLFRQKPVLKGADLKPLKVWVDANRDALVQAAELSSLASLGITEVGTVPRILKNAHGEYVIQSYFVQNGQRHMTEDVWFAEDPATQARTR